jgi:hypothetical protein
MNLLNPSRSWSNPLVLIEGWQPNGAEHRQSLGVGKRLSRWFSQPQRNHSSAADARLVLSGRINDVCAELERLAALEDKH